MTPNPRLISDLARLATKYKPSDWEQIIACLDDEKQRAQIRSLLVELGEASKTHRKKPRRSGKQPPSRTVRVREALSQIRVRDPARAELLDDIWLRLRERELLPTVAGVRAFAEAVGLKSLVASRRDQAVPELMERLIELPTEILEERLRDGVVKDRDLGDEYASWVQLILGRPTPGSSGLAGSK
jgi:hypothetical protein